MKFNKHFVLNKLVINIKFVSVIDENVASPRLGSKVVSGELMEYLLDGDYYTYDMEKGYTRHAINGPGDHGIIVKLGAPSIINHIRMLLWDRDIRLVIVQNISNNSNN